MTPQMALRSGGGIDGPRVAGLDQGPPSRRRKEADTRGSASSPRRLPTCGSWVKDPCAFSLIELLCVIGIIAILATLLAGAAGNVLARISADAWAERAQMRMERLQTALRPFYEAHSVTMPLDPDQLKAANVISDELYFFLKDRRVRFVPFTSGDPDDLIVLTVVCRKGFFTEGDLMLSKAEITPPR